MELETYLQRDALIALDLASSTTETAAGDGCSATEYACKAAGASKPCSGPPVRQPLAERRRTATQAATSTPDAIPCRARRRGAAPVPPVAPAAAAMSTSHRSSAWENRHQVIATDLAALAKLGTSRSSAGSALRDRRRATVPGCHGPAASAAAAGRGLQRRTASVEDVITQVLLSVDRDDVTATLDRLEDRPDQARSISENQQPRSRPQGVCSSIRSNRGPVSHSTGSQLVKAAMQARAAHSLDRCNVETQFCSDSILFCCADAALLSSRPELSARLAAARIQGLSKQLAECRATKQQHSREASAAAHEAAQLRKERGALQQQAASLQAQVVPALLLARPWLWSCDQPLRNLTPAPP